jgi:hypothetical protein
MNSIRPQVEAILLLLKRLGWMIAIAALPLSNTWMSIGAIWMGCVVLVERILYANEYRQKGWLRSFALPNDHSIWLIVLYACSVIGLIFTEDMSHGMWDLRMKLPLLVWPLIVAWIRPLSPEHKKQTWGVYLVALCVAVLFCAGVYLRLFGKEWQDVRSTSIFISHIRFGMMLALGVAVVWHYAFDRGWKGRLLIVVISILFLGYLIAIESLTGVLLIFVVILWNMLFQMRQWTSVVWRRGVLLVLIGVPMIAMGYVLLQASMYFQEPPVSMASLPQRSTGGELYQLNLDNQLAIRGEYVFGRIATEEMQRTWLQRSGIDAQEVLENGFPISATLIRYLTAMHQPKDSVGVMSLSDQDIRNVLSGMTSPEQAGQNGLQRRLEAIFFELACYQSGADPSGHSITQRWEFWRAARHIIAQHPWIGVGTGDTKRAFQTAYNDLNSALDDKHRLRAHNQYLTQWLTFGILGLFVWLAVLVAAWRRGQWRFPLWSSFLLIAALSCLTEDTLESQAGVTFVAFFYVWIKHSRHENESSDANM